MADKKELDININEGSSSSDNKRKTNSESSEGNKSVFKKRIRTAHNGIDIVGRIKDIAEDKVYESVNAKSGGGDAAAGPAGTIMAKKAANAAGLGVAVAANVVKKTVTTSIGIAGMFVNEGTNAAIANAGMAINKTTSAIGSIGAGAFAGGPAGAIAAAAGVVANEALEMAKAAFENSRNNAIKAAESTRVTDRLGYIETGYNR